MTDPTPACACGKRLYLTREDADQALMSVRIESGLHGNERRREQRVYQCPIRAGWHLSSTPTAKVELRHQPDDDAGARKAIEGAIALPSTGAVWNALLDPRYARQTERVLALLLSELQVEMNRRKTAVEEASWSSSAAEEAEIRASYRNWINPTIQRQRTLAARRRDARRVVHELHNIDYGTALRLLAIAVEDHRQETSTPTSADQRLWASLDSITVELGGSQKPVRALLPSGSEED